MSIDDKSDYIVQYRGRWWPSVCPVIVLAGVVDAMIIAVAGCRVAWGCSGLGTRCPACNTQRCSRGCTGSRTTRRKRLANCTVHNGPVLPLSVRLLLSRRPVSAPGFCRKSANADTEPLNNLDALISHSSGRLGK